MRQCSTCQHIKRAEIDRRLAAGEPGKQIARDYQLNPSSMHRHRVNCLGLPSSSATMKEVARGTAAVAFFELSTAANSVTAAAGCSTARWSIRYPFRSAARWERAT